MPVADIVHLILNHPDNYEPITAEWLRSIEVYAGENPDGGPSAEHEAIIQVIDTRTNTPLHESYGKKWEESTVLGYNVENGTCYLETWGGARDFSVESHEIITLEGVKTRLEFRLLLAAHKVWGYTGK